MTFSATAGTPMRPSTVDTTPSCITPPVDSRWSSQWDRTGSSSMRPYSMARRIRRGFMTGIPSSDRPTMPALCIPPISANSSPARPTDTAPIGKRRVPPTAAARRSINSVTADVSLTGLVFAIAATAVNPPAAAAASPVAMVSLYSKPGSRRWTCISRKPGATTQPWASMMRGAGRGSSGVCCKGVRISGPSAIILPSAIHTSTCRSIPWAGSITRPPRMRMSTLTSSQEQIQERHADGHAVGHLGENHRLEPIRHLWRNLYAAVHGPWMHHEHAGFGTPQTFRGETIALGIFLQRRKQHLAVALALDAQHHDRISALNSGIEIARALHPHLLDAYGQHG